MPRQTRHTGYAQSVVSATLKSLRNTNVADMKALNCEPVSAAVDELSLILGRQRSLCQMLADIFESNEVPNRESFHEGIAALARTMDNELLQLYEQLPRLAEVAYRKGQVAPQ